MWGGGEGWWKRGWWWVLKMCESAVVARPTLGAGRQAGRHFEGEWRERAKEPS